MSKWRFDIALPFSIALLTRVLERIPHPEDFHLAQKCLEGDEQAITHFQKRHGMQVHSYLLGRGASPAEAQEIVDSLWADCLAGTLEKRPRIASYQGASSLQTWLNTVAMNTFLTARRSEARTNRLMPVRIHDSESAEEEGQASSDADLSLAAEDHPAAEEPLITMLREAIEQAFKHCSSEDFVLLQLAHCDGIRQAELARIWECDTATISRKLKRAQTEVGTRIIEYVMATDPYLELEWSDFLDLCRVANPACFGQEG